MVHRRVMLQAVAAAAKPPCSLRYYRPELNGVLPIGNERASVGRSVAIRSGNEIRHGV